MTSTPPTTTFTRAQGPTGPAGPGGPGGPARPAPALAPPGSRRQRRWSLALVALLVTLGSALAFVVLWMNAGNREPVLVLRRDVPAGQAIVADDLSVVRVSADSGVTPVSSSERDDVIGQPAAADLLAGSLLTPDSVGDNEGLAGGEVLAAIPIPVEEFPEVETGNRVLLYRTSTSPGAGEPPEAELIGDGLVFSIRFEEGDSDVRVLVKISESLAEDVAAAQAADQIFMVRAGAG